MTNDTPGTFMATSLKKLPCALALMLLSAAPAMADVINFQTLDPTIFGGGEYFSEGGYTMTVLDTSAGNGFGFAGGIANGMDDQSCALAACPSRNNSYYYLGVNDGSLQLARGDNRAFTISHLDYAYLAPLSNGMPGAFYGQLRLTGTKAGSGDTLSVSYDFPALDAESRSPFTGLALGTAFSNTAFSSLVISACGFTASLDCINPAGNQAQFAIDNLSLAAVPEPDTYALLGLGLAGMALVSRRRAQRAKTANNAANNVANNVANNANNA